MLCLPSEGEGKRVRMHQHGADDAAGRCEAVLPEPSALSDSLASEGLGQKDVEHARGCDEQVRSAKLDSGDMGAKNLFKVLKMYTVK